MKLNGDLDSKEIAKRKKIRAREPHLTVNQRLFLDYVIDVIEDVILADIMEVRKIASESLKKWESIHKMWISNLENASKDELKTAMDQFIAYFEQIASKRLGRKLQDQELKKSLYKAREEYFKKYHFR